MKIELAGLPMILFVVFLILKLCKVITWSWWWVTSPLWLFILFVIAVVILYVLTCIVMMTRKYRKNQSNGR